MNPRQFLVVFTPSGRRARFEPGTTVLDAARRLGVDLDSVCGGRGICGRCQVAVSEGEHAKHGISCTAAALGPLSGVEQSYAETHELAPTRRLGCTARIDADVVIDVPPESQVYRQVVRKEADARAIAVDPVVRLHYVEVEEPELASPTSDSGRLLLALEREWGLTGLTVDIHVLQQLQHALRKGDPWRVTVAVHDGTSVTAIWPEFHDTAYGIAFDVGSTTVAGHLCDLHTGNVLASAGEMNPQIRFGEDLMSRVSYVMLNAGAEKELTRAVRGCLAKLTAELATAAEVERTDILEVTFVGNPVMHHLLLGIDPTELGGAPFALAVDTSLRLQAAELGLPVNPGARAYVLPCIAGHVGADTAGVILSEAPYEADEVTLIVDVGTNAEIVLGNRGRLLAASSPTGPAFEGAQISGGQRAAPGAIERVRIDPGTLEPRVRVIGCEAWSDEPGFAEARVTGICGSGIVEAIAELHLAGVIATDGTIDGALASRSARVVPDGRTHAYVLHDGEPELRVTQNDVRQIQLAKGALHAGCTLLMERYGIERVPRIRLAGAFGAHIDPVHALVLGLVPDCDPSQVTSAGNAAGTGARIALLDRSARAEIEDVVRRVEKVETAVEPRFQEHFVNAMAIPHEKDPYERLAGAGVVLLPARKTGAANAAGRRRRARPAAAETASAGPESARERKVHDRRRKSPEWRTRRAPGGTASRARRARAVPDPDARAGRGSVGRGPLPPGGERRPDPRGGRDRVPRRSRRARAVRRSRRERRRPARPVPERPLPLARPGNGSTGVHPGCAEPRQRRRLRRSTDDLRAGIRLAVRPRPRRRSTVRHDRGLPELREARPTPRRGSTTRAARSASPSTCR